MLKILDIFLKYQQKFFLNKKKRKILLSSRQIGKSFTIAGILCFKALSKHNGLSLCISTGSRAAGEIIRKCAQFAEAIKVLSKGKIDYSASFDQIKFSNGCRVLSLPSSTDGANLRGFTANCVCVDEGAFIPHLDDVLQAINPTLSRDPDAELIFTTTPGGMNGPFYEIYQTAKNDPNWYVQETTIYDAIADGLKIDLESLRTLCQDPEVFAQEYECKWMSEYGAMFDVGQLDWYEEAPKEAKAEYMSMDVGRTHDRSAIVIAKTYKDITYVDDIIMLNKTPYDEQLKIVKELHAKHHFQAGLIDAGGIGSALAEFVTKQVSVKITGIQFTATNKTSMFEALRAGVFDHKIKFNVKFKSLVESDFRNVQRVVNEVGSVKYIAGHNDQGHSDAATAIVLVIKAIHDNPLNVAVPVPYCNVSTFGARRSIL